MVSEVWKHLVDVDLGAVYVEYKTKKAELDGAIKSIEGRMESFSQEARTREAAIRELEK